MKRKNLYITCASLVTACVIYTFANFTNPADKEQEQSVFTNALQLIDHSFSNISESEKNVTITEAGFSMLPDLLSSSDAKSKAATAVKEKTADEELVTIASLTASQIAEIENEAIEIDDESELSKDSLGNGSEENTEKTSTKKSENKSAKKSKKKSAKETVKDEKDETVTILSISNTSIEEEDIAISTASSYVNIREEANTDSKILGKLYKDNAAHILKAKGDWLYIASGNVKGYVKAEYVKDGLTQEELAAYGTIVATVNTDGLNVREKTSTDSKRVDVVYLGETYPVLKQNDEWVKIDIEDDGVKGFVKAEYVEVTMSFSEAISIEEENALRKAEEDAKRAEEAKKAAANAASSGSSSKGASVETVYGSSTAYSSDELKLLATLVHSEAGNQSYEGKLAVANVVLNRVKSSKYPNSIYKVIYQSGQFSVASSGSLQKQLDQYSNYNSSSQRLSIQAAKDALAGVNNVGNRLYFNRYSKSLANSHSNGLKIQDHLFW